MGKQVEEIGKSYVECEHLMGNIISAICLVGKLLTRLKKSPFSNSNYKSLNYTVQMLTYIFK